VFSWAAQHLVQYSTGQNNACWSLKFAYYMVIGAQFKGDTALSKVQYYAEYSKLELKVCLLQCYRCSVLVVQHLVQYSTKQTNVSWSLKFAY